MHVPSLLVSALLAFSQVNCILGRPSSEAVDSSAVSAAASNDSASSAAACSCRSPLVRKEWRTLSSKEKLGFIAAIKCMQAKPAKTTSKFPGSKSRYDDYQALHISHTDFIHFDGLFLPWHRYMLYLFESDLRSTCSYSGTIPYWNWALDASSGEDNVLKSPIFDPVYGFGGNGPYIANISSFPDDWKTMVDIPGRQGGGCITDGPFKDRQIPLGPGNHTEYTPHCLRRDISPWLITQTGNSSVLNWALQATSHWDLDHRIEGLSLAVSGMTLHAAGHLGVGGMIGDMANTYSSPGDPLFYLHHSMIDHVWDTWQRKAWPARKTDIGGPDTMWAYPYNYFGDIPYKNVTLQTPLDYGLMASTITINDVMDTQGGQLCYTYA